MRFPITKFIKNTLFKQFCGGETLVECENIIMQLSSSNIHSILDYSVEGVDKEENFEKTVSMLDEIIEMDAGSDAISFSVLKLSSIASPSILEKIQQGTALSGLEQDIFDRIKIRLDSICRRAADKKVKLLIDAEESWIQGIVDILVYSMMSKYNKQAPFIFNTFQMYRSDMEYNLNNAIAMAKADGFFLGVKLVRGAYMEKEREKASRYGYKNPVYESKQETDAAFNKALELCLDNIEYLELCCGSHNEESNMLLTSLMEKKQILPGDSRVYFAQLFGMGDHISYNLAKAGYNTAKYIPFGPIEHVLPYLFRRAEENTAMVGQTSRELGLIKKEIARRKKTASS